MPRTKIVFVGRFHENDAVTAPQDIKKARKAAIYLQDFESIYGAIGYCGDYPADRTLAAELIMAKPEEDDRVWSIPEFNCLSDVQSELGGPEFSADELERLSGADMTLERLNEQYFGSDELAEKLQRTGTDAAQRLHNLARRERNGIIVYADCLLLNLMAITCLKGQARALPPLIQPGDMAKLSFDRTNGGFECFGFKHSLWRYWGEDWGKEPSS